MASAPIPVPNLLFQPRPWSSRAPLSGSGPTSDGSPAPWVLPNVWPPAISATVSSSFMAMRKNVSRISFAAATGSGLPFGTFRVDVDQAHLNRTERLRQLTLAAIAFIAQPRPFRTPVELLGLPHVGASAGEAEGLEAHRFQRDVAGENHQVGPRDLLAIFLLDGPQQAARLIQVRVVRPAIQRGEALLPRAGAAAAVGNPISPGAVPCHADHQPAIMAEIGRPPILGVCHQGMQILDHRIEVKAFKLLGVVEPVAHGVGQAGVPVKNRDVQRVRPPVAVPATARDVRDRALRGACYSLAIVGGSRRCLFYFFFHRVYPFLRIRILSGKRAGARTWCTAPGK